MKLKEKVAGLLKQKGTRSGLWYGGGLVLEKITAFAMAPIFTHFMVPADYGRLDILMTLGELLFVLFAVWMTESLFRFSGMAKTDQERRDFSATLHAIALTVCVALLIIGQLTAPWINDALPESPGLTETRLLLGGVSFGVVLGLGFAWFRLSNQPKVFFMMSYGRTFVQACCACVLLALGFGLEGVMWAMFSAYLIFGFSSFRRMVKQMGVHLSPERLRPVLRYAWPLLGVGIMGFVIRSLDRWVVGGHLGAETLALYALAAKFGAMVYLPGQAFDLWWGPKRFVFFADPEKREFIPKWSSVGLAINTATCILVAGCAPLVIEWLTPESYHGAGDFVPWLGLMTVIHCNGRLFNLGLYVGSGAQTAMYVEAFIAGLIALGYWAFAADHGAIGIIGTATAALSIRLPLVYFLAQRQNPLPYNKGSLMLNMLSIGPILYLVSSVENPWSKALLSIPLTVVGASIAAWPVIRAQLVARKS